MFKQLKYLTQITPSHEHMQFQWFIKKNPNEQGKHWKFAEKAPALDPNTDFNERISELGLTLEFLGGLTVTSRAKSGKMQEKVIFFL